ncbi:MAG: hypothetical protein OQK51_10620 [Kangiellaceae bacterium]|nr:hypothetical protein [Kangiellaceae bacterium]
MVQYKNLGGDSNVLAYEQGEDFIRIAFKDSSVFLYTVESAGIMNIQNMNLLAKQGKELNAYINRYVRYLYAAREK